MTGRPLDSDITWHQGAVGAEERRAATGLVGATVWLTGLSGSGKSTVAVEVERRLVERSLPVSVLDGDNLRHGLNAGLGFDAAGRAENVRRVGEVAILLAQSGVIALAPLVSPYRADRDMVRARHDESGVPFVEVHVATPLEECERRDPKGLYAKARRGELRGFTGIDDPWEPPVDPDLTLEGGDPSEQADRVVAHLDAEVLGYRREP